MTTYNGEEEFKRSKIPRANFSVSRNYSSMISIPAVPMMCTVGC
jgi:hypothetical protein